MNYEDVLKLEVVKVKWMDANDDVLKLDSYEKEISLCERVTVGFLLRETKDIITIVRDITIDGDLEVTNIPTAWVKV